MRLCTGYPRGCASVASLLADRLRLTFLWSVAQLGKPSPKPEARPADARAHSAKRYVERLRDFLVAEAAPGHENGSIAVTAGNPVQGLGEPGSQLGGLHPADRDVGEVLSGPSNSITRAAASLLRSHRRK